MNSRDVRICQRIFDAPASVDPPQRSVSDKSHPELRTTKDGIAHSAVTRIVPLKPQRSKKSLSKENKGPADPRMPNESDVLSSSEAEQMVGSKEQTSGMERRAGDDATRTSATDKRRKYHSAGATPRQRRAEQSRQVKNEPLRDADDATAAGQRTRADSARGDSGPNHAEWSDNLPSSSKFPTAPPRTLPLKKQWSRDRQSDTDGGHVHHRAPSQETSRRKQAVNPLPPPPPPH